VIALAVCLVLSVLSIVRLRESKPVEHAAAHQLATQSVEAATSSPKLAASNGQTPTAAALATRHPQPRHLHAGKLARPSRSDDVNTESAVITSGDFVALPTFDPAIPIGLSRVVRLDLPGPALQLIGYPVDGQLLNRHVLTDVLVGQDGMPYAVRLVETGSVY
jgi:hypothetical protein